MDRVRILEFADETGLDKPVFCTFRLGRTLAQSVQPGEMVFLAHRGFAFAVAEVVTSKWGRAEQVLAEHIGDSHLSLTPEQGMALLQKTYGPHKAGPTSFLSAIWLKRITA